MYPRHTKAERHDRKVQRFEYSHPKNKYVIQRLKWRDRARDAARKFIKYILEGENYEAIDQ